MGRIVRRILVGASSFCLATLALWGRSYFKSDSIDRFRRDAGGPGTYHDSTDAFATYGLFGAGYLRMHHPTTQEWPASPHWRFNTTPAAPLAWERRWWVLGFSHWRVKFPPNAAHSGMYVVGFSIPHWFIALLFGVAPGMSARRWWLARRRRRRLLAGLCANCGYDVRAGGERCPECGTAIERIASPSV